MRQSSKTNKQATLSNVQRYHEGGYGLADREAYAYIGFKSNKYFTSDRFINLDANFNRPDGKPLKGYGLEIETECRGLTNQTVYAEVLTNIIFAHFPADLFKLQNDGSLSGDTSAECITQVMTKEFIRNNYSNFKLMYDTYFKAFGVSCSLSGNCGMHVNISTACFGKSEAVQATAIRKLYYLINRNFNLMCALLNRNINRTTYCDRMPADLNYCKTLDLSNAGGNHYICFNLAHYTAGRIELRLVGGQSNYACFRNTMECIFHLVEIVKTISWSDIDDITKIFEGCNQYVFDRLNSKCREAQTITESELQAIKQTVKREELL